MADPQSTPSDERSDPSGEDVADRTAAGEETPGTEDDGTVGSPDSDETEGSSADENRPRSPEDDEEDAGTAADPESVSTEELRRRVEEEYDFDDFGPAQMEQMSVDEWEVAFDADSWITGDELLDRVAADLRSQIASRDVFAVLEEVHEGGGRRLLAYSDEGYALVYPDGSIEGFGTVLRDVKPTVALCSMDSYDPPEPPEDRVLLPDPEEVPEASGEFGNLMLQLVAASMILAGLLLIGAWLAVGLTVIAPAAGLFFLLVGLFLFGSVANARLSDRFRAEEYRDRLRAVGLADGERPDFLPVEDGEVIGPDRRESLPAEERAEDPPVDG